MTPMQKKVMTLLLEDGYISPSPPSSKWTAYKGVFIPLFRFPRSTYRVIKPYLREEWFARRTVYVLNKKHVRALHGKHWLKQQYKLTLKNKQNEKVDDTADAAGGSNNDKL